MSGKVARFEHFEILKDDKGELIKLGPGGMGATYRAYDMHLRKLVALKIINDRTLADPTARRRFFNEARAAASIDHPNVARVIYLCPEDAVDCSFAMELVEGQTVARRIGEGGPLPPAEALVLLRPIADALIALGVKGLVHRDIKPENIMLTRGLDGRSEVKLIDFGLAKNVSANTSLFESVHTGERFVGSVYFASPEQIRPTSGIDCRSDFYSLGATLWYAVTGAPPFTGAVFEIQEAHVYREPAWDKIAALPAPLTVLLKKLLAKSPAQRPPDGSALVAAWDDALAAMAGSGAGAVPGWIPAPAVGANGSLADVSPLRASSPPAASFSSASHPVAASLDSSYLAVPPPPVAEDAALRLPPGAARPSAPGLLGWDAATQACIVRRTIPPGLGAEVRSALQRGATSAQRLRHGGLLAVHSVTETEIVSAWPVAVTASEVAAHFPGGLPPAVIFAWLPRLAEAADAAHQQGLAHLGLQADRVLVGFDPARGPGASQEDLERWQQAPLWVDPLAAFDAVLVAAAQGHGSARRAPAFLSVRDYVTALARCVRDLMGGKVGAARPVPALDDARNRILFDALNYRTNPPSASEWSRTFLEPVPAVEAGSAAPPLVAHEPAVSPARDPEDNSAASILPPPQTPSRALWLIVAATIALAAILFGLWFWSPRTGSESELERQLVTQAEQDLRRGDWAKADQKIRSLEHDTPQNRHLAELKARLAGSGKSTPAPTPYERPPPVPPTPAPEASTPEAATKEMPYVNYLKMRFVPLPPPTGGNAAAPGGPQKVLISVYETRVADFQRWLAVPDNPAARVWYPQPGEDRSGPAVGVTPDDAMAFAKWLTGVDRAGGGPRTLPADWHYSLPLTSEWERAAGAAEFPWGADWPPKEPIGNLGDETWFRKSAAGVTEYLTGYDDGFASLAPAGSFRPNAFGIYDLAGNAAEWCFNEKANWVLCGGSRTSYRREELRCKYHLHPNDLSARWALYGFRLVLLKGPRAALAEEAGPHYNGARPNIQPPSVLNFQPH